MLFNRKKSVAAAKPSTTILYLEQEIRNLEAELINPNTTLERGRFLLQSLKIDYDLLSTQKRVYAQSA